MLTEQICSIYHTKPIQPGSAPGKPKLFIMKPSRAWGLLWLNGSWQWPQETKIAAINPCARLVFFSSLLSRSLNQCQGGLASHSLQTWSPLGWQQLESTRGKAWHKNAMLHDEILHNFIHNSSVGLVMLEPHLQIGGRKGVISINVCPSGLTKPSNSCWRNSCNPDLGIVLNDVTQSLFLDTSVVQNVPKTSERICLSKFSMFLSKIF